MTRYCIFLFWLLVFQTTFSQQVKQLDPSISEKIDYLFTEFDNLNSPGYAIGVSKSGETIYQKGYGSANLDYDIPLSPTSRFSIASVSKQFTAACIALLIVENKLSLETPVGEILPEVNIYKEVIRVKHLVYNTSGITDYHRLPRANGTSWITFNYFDVDECINTSLSVPELLFNPGDQWDYCNVNFILLTKIVEKVSGMTFRAFAEEKLFAPLGMFNTIIHDDITEIVPNRVTPYNFRTEEAIESYQNSGIKISESGEFIQHPRNAPHFGGSGVMTTIVDLLKWCENMVTKDFGGQEFYDIMHATPTFNHDRNNQAFGLYTGDFNGRKIIAWDGGDWGISAQLMRFPDQEIAITVLSNIGTGEAYRKVNNIADILIENEIIK